MDLKQLSLQQNILCMFKQSIPIDLQNKLGSVKCYLLSKVAPWLNALESLRQKISWINEIQTKAAGWEE